MRRVASRSIEFRTGVDVSRQCARPMAMVASVLTLCACQEQASQVGLGEWAGTVDTLDSGRILIHNPDQPVWTESEQLQLRERYRLGSLEGDGPDVFGQIRDVELGPDGELYVLDGQAADVRVFGSDGVYVRTLGRSGAGPGEFNRPAGMALDAQGALWVMNWGNARYTAYDPGTGELLREVRRLPSFAVTPWPGGFDERGRLLDVGLDRDGEVAILRLDTAFVLSDTLAVPQAGDENRIVFRRNGFMVMSMLVPFAPGPAWAPRARGGIAVGEGAEYRLHRIDFGGDTTMTIELSRERVRVTASERDSALAAFSERAATSNGTPDRRPRVPELKPAHGTLFVDNQDRIWVRGTAPAGATPVWDVIGEDGRFLGQIQIPEFSSLRVFAERGDLVALPTQVDGVPTVVVYDLASGVR